MLSKIQKGFWVTVLAALVLAGCGGGGSSPPPPPALTFTNGDAVPELTDVPVLPASWTAVDSGTFNITVPVDSDTAGVYVDWGTGLNTYSSKMVTLAPGSAQNATITIVPVSGVNTPPGTTYSVQVFLCNNNITCNPTNTGSVSLYTVTGSGAYTNTSTYSKLTGPAGLTSPGKTYTETGVAMPLMSVVATAPTIASFSPTSGGSGMSVIITGTNFSTTPANNTVKFNGVTATVTDATATQLSVTVPATATTGPISVTTPGGTATSASSFTVSAPAVPSISTTLASPTILGLNTVGTYWLANGVKGYLDIPDVAANGKAYGIYITGANPTLSTVNQVNSIISLTGEKFTLATTAGIPQALTSGAAYNLEITGDANTAVSFSALIKEGLMGGQTTGTATPITVATPTWIGANFNNGVFGPFTAAAAGNVVADLINLTFGVDVSVLDSAGVVVGTKAAGVVTDRAFIATLPVPAAGTYYLWTSDLSANTSDAAVGKLTVTMP